MTRRAKTAAQLLWENAAPGAPGDCWIWTGRTNDSGYGIVRTFERQGDGTHKRVNHRVHRVAYVWRHGSIDDALALDHTCHNQDATCPGGPTCRHRACFNPDHLRPKSTGENVLSSPLTVPSRNTLKTHCPQGHEYTPENTALDGATRRCRTCLRERSRAAYAQRKAVTPQQAQEPTLHPNTLKTHCPQGHEYTPENTYMAPKGSRVCKICQRERLRAWKRAHKQK